MIKYRLQCANGHEFEGWFASSASYDSQVESGQLTCPECNSREVGKSIMAPNVATRARPTAPTTTCRPVTATSCARLRGCMTTSSEDVGARFPEEARKIHYREVEQRAIRGTASLDEARALVEEGVEIMALPRLPEDTN